jgi:hypothetical protein
MKEWRVPPITAYEVGFEYCNKVDFKHHHENTIEATQEYASLLAQAIEPSPGENSGKVHLREIYLLAFDKEGQVAQTITSGIFECEHRA